MKKIFNTFGIILSVALAGVLGACTPTEQYESADVGLGIKTFFPTKVVAGQPMTINGSGFSDVTEIVFPNDIRVTGFEIVSGEMLRVIAPAGISADGGKIIVVTPDDRVESRVALTLGRTAVSGFSKQDGEEIEGGQQLTVYGQDLEFINAAEFLDEDGNPLRVPHEGFYRKGTSTVIITVPKKVFEGTFVGKLFTYDGQEILLPELAYKPATDGGHWETEKKVIWENPGAGPVSWSGAYRFALEGHDGNNECIAEFPQDIWDKLLSETFYVTVEGENPQVRVTNGHWSAQWLPDDIQPGNERMTDNGDGTWTIEINISDNPEFVETLLDRHLLLTGDRYTPLNIYFFEDVWMDGGSHWETVKTTYWQNPGAGPVSWSGAYRFALEGHDGNNECIAEFPQDIWDKLLSETFYVTVEGENPQVRVTNGHWSAQWLPDDIQPGNERMTDNGDGTWTVEINISDNPEFVETLLDRHLLLTGDRYTPLDIYTMEEVWVDGGDGGDDGPKEIDIAPFTYYEDQSATLTYPYYPSWGDNSGKLRIMRGGDPAIETLGLTTSSKFIVYKVAGTTGQIQFNTPNWGDFNAGCADWDGSLEMIEVAITEDMLKCISGEVSDGWSNTAIILQGDGMTVNKIVIVP